MFNTFDFLIAKSPWKTQLNMNGRTENILVNERVQYVYYVFFLIPIDFFENINLKVLTLTYAKCNYHKRAIALVTAVTMVILLA